MFLSFSLSPPPSLKAMKTILEWGLNKRRRRRRMPIPLVSVPPLGVFSLFQNLFPRPVSFHLCTRKPPTTAAPPCTATTPGVPWTRSSEAGGGTAPGRVSEPSGPNPDFSTRFHRFGTSSARRKRRAPVASRGSGWETSRLLGSGSALCSRLSLQTPPSAPSRSPSRGEAFGGARRSTIS